MLYYLKYGVKQECRENEKNSSKKLFSLLLKMFYVDFPGLNNNIRSTKLQHSSYFIPLKPEMRGIEKFSPWQQSK